MDTLVAASKLIGLRAIVQVEHDMDIVFGYSDRIIAPPRGQGAGGRAAGDDPGRPARDGHRHRPQGRDTSACMLSLTGVDVFIQTSQILRGVSLEVGAREVVCLVGRNGAGKTTTLRTHHGVPQAQGRYRRASTAGPSRAGAPTRSPMLGLGWAPEDSGIFSDLTVAENIEIATWTRAERPAGRRAHRAGVRRVSRAPPLRRAQGPGDERR